MSEIPTPFVHEFRSARDPSKAPTLLLLHGTGGNERDLLELGSALAPSANLLSPRGRVLENGMPRFFRRLAEGVFDLEDLKTRTHELADFVEASAITYGFNAASIIAAGYSNGANIAAAMMLLRPDVLAGSILLRPMVPLVPKPLPDLERAPVLIEAGSEDPIVSPQQTEDLAALLRAANAEVTVHRHEAGHGLVTQDFVVAQEWLRAIPSPGTPGEG